MHVTCAVKNVGIAPKSETGRCAVHLTLACRDVEEARNGVLGVPPVANKGD